MILDTGCGMAILAEFRISCLNIEGYRRGAQLSERRFPSATKAANTKRFIMLQRNQLLLSYWDEQYTYCSMLTVL